MTEIAELAINSINAGKLSFCKFITANDTGTTGSHQSGFYIPKTAYGIFFDKPGNKGSNKDKFIKIKWQDNSETTSRAIYYGQGTRNEYRLTVFGRSFPYLQDEYTGGLLILTKFSEDYYQAFVLNEDVDIDDFLDAFGMTPADTNQIITKQGKVYPAIIENLMNKFLATLTPEFPSTTKIAEATWTICSTTNQMVLTNPDASLLDWLTTEYELFKKIEIYYYKEKLSKHFESVEQFIDMANSILNRRKSRAGKSLEHHLDTVFKINKLKFSHPGKTEGNKKPDFIFPGNNEYQSYEFAQNKLVFLGAKTTCKDRWRQILNEAKRIPVKHLFTLQQGISKNQLVEIYESGVILVVPQKYISTYPREYQDKILSLKQFLNFVQLTQ